MAFKEKIFSFILLVVTVSSELIPNYDVPDRELKVYDMKNPLLLSCNGTIDETSELIWEKDGVEVSKVENLKDRYKIIPAENIFLIERTNEFDNGTYSCSANGEKKNFTVISTVIVHVQSNVNVVEGEKLTVHCATAGTNARVVWMYSSSNQTIENGTNNIKIINDEKGVENAILIIENVSLEDAGEYKCVGRNPAVDYAGKKEASDTTIVRVKGKLAALWPFLGICAEVFVLCAIILIYEKRRNKTELEESDTDNNDPKKKRRNYD